MCILAERRGKGERFTKVDQGALRVLAQGLEGVEEQGDVGLLLSGQFIGVGVDRRTETGLLAACGMQNSIIVGSVCRHPHGTGGRTNPTLLLRRAKAMSNSWHSKQLEEAK